MSRSAKFISGLGASYVGVAANIAYSLAIVPIGLYYLGIDQFGLWMLLSQAASYLALIELGVYGSTARILIDYKDRKDGAAYTGIVATASLILIAQGILIASLCWLLAPFVIQIFDIPSDLRDLAIYLLVFMGLNTGLSTCFKIFTAILYANQRIDLVVLFQAACPLLSLAIIWPLFAVGYGLEFLPWGFFPPMAFLSIVSWFACRRLGLLPPAVKFSDISLTRLRELFTLGADYFLVNIGTQLLEASQLMIVSRTMGLPAAAIWSISTKLFTLLFMLTAKIDNTAIVFFSEMMVRGEQIKLRSCFKKMYQLTGSLAVCGMLGAVAVNPYFVAVWAGPDLLWSPINNWLIAVLLILNLLLRCHTDLATHTKNVGLLRFLFFFESLAFVTAALWAAPRFGFTGILASSLVCALVFRLAYAINRTASYFAVPRRSVTFTWLAFLAMPFLIMSMVAFFVPFMVDHLPSALARSLASATIVTIAAGAVMCSVGLQADMRPFFYGKLRAVYDSVLTTLGK